jgi:hypothetical protein
MSRGATSALVFLGLFACNSDALFDSAAPESTGEPGSTGSTGEVVTTTGEDASTGSTGAGSTGAGSTGEPPPEEKTCEDFLNCIPPCALSMDPMCFADCAEGLSPDALPQLGQLGLCVGGGCFESGACELSLESLQDPLCLACIGLGLLNPNPPGCEEQADACHMSG